MKNFTTAILIFLACSFQIQAQRGYSKDSLQIKVYTVITYTNNNATNLEVTKVFCDYCSDIQKAALENEAWRRAYDERYYPEHRLENGKKRLALYIRVAKNDFAQIKEDILEEDVSPEDIIEKEEKEEYKQQPKKTQL